jgi:hypothetical protein
MDHSTVRITPLSDEEKQRLIPSLGEFEREVKA